MELKSPTCTNCARCHGLVAVTSCFTVQEAKCANCGEVKYVSSVSDWKKPGQHIPAAAID